jgi:resuscitation-promoting factor RpfB
VMNQTPVWPPPPRRGFWARLSPVQRIGLVAAALILPCCGGIGVIGALTGGPEPAAIKTPAAEQLAGAAADEKTIEAVAPTTAATTATTAAATTAPATKKTVTVRKSIAYATRKVDDDTLAEGRTKVRTKGVAGTRTLTYQVTVTGGEETARELVSDVVTKKPVTKVIAVGTKADEPSGNCDSNYTPCVPIASDVDCAGGSGNGPAYVEGPVTVIGDDIYDLDRDSDGVGCDT